MRDFDHTKVKPGDRFLVTEKVASTDELGKEITVASIAPGIFGFYATDGFAYDWSQVEPIRPQLITRLIEGMPEWLASTPKGEAVKCRVKYEADEPWLSDPIWIVGRNKFFGLYSYIDTEGFLHPVAEPWTEPDAELKPSHFTPEQLAELDARYGRKDA